MLSTADILAKLKAAKPLFEQKYGITSMALFGSYSRTDATEESDVDIVVDFVKPIGIKFVDFADELEDLLQKKVDLVSLKGIKPRYLSSVTEDMIYV